MATVIEIEDKKKRKMKAIDQDRATKASALLKVFECASCYLKCARCGVHLKLNQTQHTASKTPYRFCSTCSEEFAEFQSRMDGDRDKDLYWYNDEWLDMWKAWTGYQKAIKRFLNSKEVIRLRYELRKG